MIADLRDSFCSLKPFITPPNPISPVKKMVITSRIISASDMTTVNIVMKPARPIKKIIMYAGTCISFIIIFTRNNSLASLFLTRLAINTAIELINAMMYITSKMNKRFNALLLKTDSIKKPVKMQTTANKMKYGKSITGDNNNNLFKINLLSNCRDFLQI